MIGKVFGRLTVLGIAEHPDKKNKRYLCVCECEKETVVLGYKLRGGQTKSCGCYAKEFREALVSKADVERRLYTKNSHQAMIGRCTNPKYPSYLHYGAKGIKVCDRWLYGDGDKTGWLCFFEDMGPKPSGHSIDRIDNNKGYYPDNCRWADRFTQARNRKKRSFKTPPVPLNNS